MSGGGDTSSPSGNRRLTMEASVTVECPDASLPFLGVTCRPGWLLAWSGDCIAKYSIEETTADMVSQDHMDGPDGSNPDVSSDPAADKPISLQLRRDAEFLAEFTPTKEEVRGLAVSPNNAFVVLATRRRGVDVDPAKKVKLQIRALESLDQSVERLEELALFADGVASSLPSSSATDDDHKQMTSTAVRDDAPTPTFNSNDLLMRLRPNVSSIEVQAMVKRLEKYQMDAMVAKQSSSIAGGIASSARESPSAMVQSMSLGKQQLLRLIWSILSAGDPGDETSSEAKLVSQLECVLFLRVAQQVCRFLLKSLEVGGVDRDGQSGSALEGGVGIGPVSQQPYAEFFGCSLKYLLEISDFFSNQLEPGAEEPAVGELGPGLREMVEGGLSAEKLTKMRQIQTNAALPEPLCSFCNIGERPIIIAKPVPPSPAEPIIGADGPAPTTAAGDVLPTIVDARYWVCKSGHKFNRCSATLLPICHNSWRRCTICYAFTLSYTEALPFFQVLPVTSWERCNLCGGMMCNN